MVGSSPDYRHADVLPILWTEVDRKYPPTRLLPCRWNCGCRIKDGHRPPRSSQSLSHCTDWRQINGSGGKGGSPVSCGWECFQNIGRRAQGIMAGWRNTEFVRRFVAFVDLDSKRQRLIINREWLERGEGYARVCDQVWCLRGLYSQYWVSSIPLDEC